MANYKARLQLKHGKKADLPTDGRLAEPMYCTDTHELAIGNDKGEEYTYRKSNNVFFVNLTIKRLYGESMKNEYKFISGSPLPLEDKARTDSLAPGWHVPQTGTHPARRPYDYQRGRHGPQHLPAQILRIHMTATAVEPSGL